MAPESNIQEVDFPVARGRDIPGLDGLSMVHDEIIENRCLMFFLCYLIT